MKKVTAKHYYNCSVDEVFRFFSNEDIIAAKYTAMGSRKFHLKDISKQSDLTKVDLLREVPASDAIPKVLKKLLGEWNKVRQSETWQVKEGGSRFCKMSIDLEGVPVKIHGKMQLDNTENGCVNHISIEARSVVPLLGKSITSFISSEILKQLENEYQYINKM